MGAILGGTMRSPFTGVIFALELTHDVNMLLPLLLAVILAARLYRADPEAVDPDREGGAARYHLSREYAVDPLEILFVREVMRTNIVALPGTETLEEARGMIRSKPRPQGQYLFPVVESENAFDRRRHAEGAVQAF